MFFVLFFDARYSTLVILSDADAKSIIEMMHKRKVEKDPALQILYNKLCREYGPLISLTDFVKFNTANPSLTSPLMMLQLHIRRQIIGEKFWEKLTIQRSEHWEQKQLDYVKKLQAKVLANKDAYRKRLAAEEAERRRLSRLGRGELGDCRDNIVRTESRLMSFFNLKKHVSSRSSKIVPNGVNAANVQTLKAKYVPEEDKDGPGGDCLIPSNKPSKKNANDMIPSAQSTPGSVRNRKKPTSHAGSNKEHNDPYVNEVGHELNTNVGLGKGKHKPSAKSSAPGCTGELDDADNNKLDKKSKKKKTKKEGDGLRRRRSTIKPKLVVV